MIIVDYNQTAISNLMAEIGGRTDIEINVPLVKHMIVNSIRGYKAKFGDEYGELVIACDNRKYWRKGYFANYKSGRKKAREDSGLDWNLIFETIGNLKKDLNDYFPYKVLDVEYAEADDIIAVMAKWSQSNNLKNTSLFADGDPQPFLIISADHDFIQLQKYKNVKQFSPIQKKFVKPERKPEHYIIEHIVRGDKGDGVPNVLSPDDCFINEIRQKPVSSKKLEEWIKDPNTMPQDDEFKKNFIRNKTLVDFSMIPEDVEQAIINSYTSSPNKDRSKLLNYFIENKMKNMLEVITEF